MKCDLLYFKDRKVLGKNRKIKFGTDSIGEYLKKTKAAGGL